MKHKYNLKTLKQTQKTQNLDDGRGGHEAKERINKRGRNKQIEIRET